MAAYLKRRVKEAAVAVYSNYASTSFLRGRPALAIISERLLTLCGDMCASRADYIVHQSMYRVEKMLATINDRESLRRIRPRNTIRRRLARLYDHGQRMGALLQAGTLSLRVRSCRPRVCLRVRVSQPRPFKASRPRVWGSFYIPIQRKGAQHAQEEYR